jgi:hypothetical protein
MKKEIAIICPNGIIKFYNSDGTRKENHPTGFYNPKYLNQLKKEFIVKFS